MQIDPLPELKEISEIQARTQAERAKGQAIIVATRQRLDELQAEIGLKAKNEEPTSSNITWLPFAMIAAIAAAVGLWAGFVLSGGLA